MAILSKSATRYSGKPSTKPMASGRMVDGNIVKLPFPAPTPEQLQAQTNAEARAYLAGTDWYVVRFAETGVAIPADILAARQAARDSIVEVAA